MKPMDIEKESFAIIEKELTTDIPAEYKPVVKRVIHTTADFSYETSMTFSKGVIEEALKAIKEGVDIVTDTNMAKSGISHKMAEKFSCSLNCYMADSDVASEAAKREVTRATVSVEKAAKAAKGDKKFLHEAEVFKALAAHLDAGKSARTFECDKDDRAIIETADLLSLKPIIYAANMDEDGFANYEDNGYFRSVRELAEKEGAQVLPICAKLEQDIAELDDPEERAMFLADLGIEKSGLDRLIQCSYDLLGLISFLTYGKDECRAWTIKKGTKAPQAAGKIHSDIERGFIRAETINFDEMMACGGSVAAAKEKGLLRSEGKEYVVKDGDMIYFRFNV